MPSRSSRLDRLPTFSSAVPRMNTTWMLVGHDCYGRPILFQCGTPQSKTPTEADPPAPPPKSGSFQPSSRRFHPYRRFPRKDGDDLDPKRPADYGAIYALARISAESTKTVASQQALATATTNVNIAATSDDQSSVNFSALSNAIEDVDGFDAHQPRLLSGFRRRIRFSALVVDFALSMRQMLQRGRLIAAQKSPLTDA